MFYDRVRLKGPQSTRIVDPGRSFQCDVFEDSDVTSCDVIKSRDVVDVVTDWRPVGTFLYSLLDMNPKMA